MSEEAKEIKTTEAAPDVSEDSDEKVSEEGAAHAANAAEAPAVEADEKAEASIESKEPESDEALEVDDGGCAQAEPAQGGADNGFAEISDADMRRIMADPMFICFARGKTQDITSLCRDFCLCRAAEHTAAELYLQSGREHLQEVRECHTANTTILFREYPNTQEKNNKGEIIKTMEDIYTWSNDMYPLVKKSFDERYAQRINYIGEVAGIVTQGETSYKLDSLGGYGLLSDYNGTLSVSGGTGGFTKTITPKEHALAMPVSYKDAKTDMLFAAKKVGVRLADSAYMTVWHAFCKLFGTAQTAVGADGVAWASKNHPVSSASGSTKFSNLMESELSLDAICTAQASLASVTTADGLPFTANYDLLLVSPDLESTAKTLCGVNAQAAPLTNPKTGVGGNPVYGMRYMVIGGVDGFGSGKWAIADSALLSEALKLVYLSEPTVLVSPRENPLVTDYVAYVDFAFGFGDARAIIFSDPSLAKKNDNT